MVTGMQIRDKASLAGIIRPAELKLLSEVFDATQDRHESDLQRDARASRILAYFQAGVTNKSELVTLARQPLGR